MAAIPAAESSRIASSLAARVEKLLDHHQRTSEEDEEMLHAAHASRHHWGEAREPARLIEGEWRCSRVYAALGRAEAALFHARRCLDLCEEEDDERTPGELARAYEALARAHLLSGERDTSRRFERLSRAICTRITDANERDLVLVDLSGLARLRW